MKQLVLSKMQGNKASFSSIFSSLQRSYYWLAVSFTTSFFLHSTPALAVLPGEDEASTIIAKGTFLEAMAQLVKEGAVYAGLILSIGALVWIGYSLIADYNQAREKGDFSSLAPKVLGALLVLLFIAYLGQQIGEVEIPETGGKTGGG